MLIGAFSINVCDNSEYYGISDYFNGFVSFIKTSSFLEMFYNSFFVFSILLLINFTLGLCLIGNVILVIILFLYSFSIGSITSFLYCKYTFIGISYFAVSILPCLFLLTLNYLLCFKNSFNFSKELLSLCKNNNVSVNIKSYIYKFLTHFVFAALFCLLFSLFSEFLINLF